MGLYIDNFSDNLKVKNTLYIFRFAIKIIFIYNTVTVIPIINVGHFYFHPQCILDVHVGPSIPAVKAQGLFMLIEEKTPESKEKFAQLRHRVLGKIVADRYSMPIVMQSKICSIVISV